MNTSLIEVVVGVIVRAGRILLTQRRHDKSYAFGFECPGGKVNGDHESHHSALRRKLLEEIGITVGAIPEHAIWSGHVGDAARRHFVSIYVVTAWKGEPVPREGQGLGWFTAHEMRALTLLPANKAAFNEITACIARSAPPGVRRASW